ncbi:calcium-binding protein [Aerosakkonemataceae cyanobacterium BLCC-F50]|uniref:Calcium-binding protein n=1 Tax=Floridaenema flaviceps BLCC-F50 TaxID=3153642 RepID=A0ABV4Y5H9_9CYAN
MPAIPPFFVLTDNADNFTIAPGLLDTLPGGLLALAGNDTITGSNLADIVQGNKGDDRLILGKGDDTIFGGAGNDTIAGEQGQDFISGDLGDDIIYGGSINNQVPDLADIIYGGEGNDTIFGQEGNDFLNGNQGNDYLTGGAGNDTIRGGKGGDVLLGDQGSDTLIGDLGQDALVGGIADAGAVDVDVFILRGDAGANKLAQADLILDFSVGDKIGITNFKGGIGSLALQEFVPIPVSQFITQLSPELQAAQKSGLINLNDLAFNGLIQGTAISLTVNGPVIGVVLNQSLVQVNAALFNTNITEA